MKKRTCKGYQCIGYLLVATNIVGLMRGAEQASFARQPKRLLVVTVAKGFRHDSIPTIERVLQQLSEKSRSFTVDYARTDDELVARTTTQALRNYDGIVFAHTSGDLPLVNRQAFLDWIKSGHSFVGTHSATDTFKGFPEYIDMIGGQFESHGPQVSVQCHLEDPNHPATKGLRTSFTVFDEIYLFSKFNRANVHMLLALDQHPNTKQPVITHWPGIGNTERAASSTPRLDTEMMFWNLIGSDSTFLVVFNGRLDRLNSAPSLNPRKKLNPSRFDLGIEIGSELQTSHNATAWRSETSGSRAGTNSCAR